MEQKAVRIPLPARKTEPLESYDPKILMAGHLFRCLYNRVMPRWQEMWDQHKCTQCTLPERIAINILTLPQAMFDDIHSELFLMVCRVERDATDKENEGQLLTIYHFIEWALGRTKEVGC